MDGSGRKRRVAKVRFVRMNHRDYAPLPPPTFTSTMVVRVPWGEYVLRPRG
jgi:hypothetical protein